MIHCKKTIIATFFSLMLPLACWSEAPVVDDSDNFAIIDGQRAAARPKYEETQASNTSNQQFDMDDSSVDDGPALVKDDGSSDANSAINDNASLIEKIQSLQQEVQELRGQLEVQAHDLKLLQQQQVAFYKDLDSRLGSASAKAMPNKAPTELSLDTKKTAPMPVAPVTAQNKIEKTAVVAPAVTPASRMNPADEQISYMAAYELVTNKRFDDATVAMQTFVQKYPNGGYTANAQYWLGELYLVKRDYPKAIEHFDLVLNKFPSSSKSAASLLKSGYAYVAQGNQQEAKKRFEQVVKNYPGTPTAKLASTKLEAINAL